MDKDQMKVLVDAILQEIAQENLKNKIEQSDGKESSNLSKFEVQMTQSTSAIGQTEEREDSSGSLSSLTVDLPDPTTDEMRQKPGVVIRSIQKDYQP